MKPDAPACSHGFLYPDTLEERTKPSKRFLLRGKCGVMWKKASKKLISYWKTLFRTGMVHQSYLEPRARRQRRPRWEGHDLERQPGYFRTADAGARFLDLPLNRIKAIPVEVGGAFGGSLFR